MHHVLVLLDAPLFFFLIVFIFTVIDDTAHGGGGRRSDLNQVQAVFLRELDGPAHHQHPKLFGIRADNTHLGDFYAFVNAEKFLNSNTSC